MNLFRLLRWSTASAVIAVGSVQAAPPPERAPEWAIKLNEIAFGDPMKGGTSPMSISKTRYGWGWLAKQQGIPENGTLTRATFRGSGESFDRLDRDGDGELRAADFDWSSGSDYIRQQATATALFNRVNGDGNGTISGAEWQAMFDKVAGPSGAVTAEDLRKALYVNSSRPSVSGVNGPTRWMRLHGFWKGELGSWHEGPNPGDSAPDFILKTQDLKTTIRLSSFQGDKPVVLIFGNFT